MLEVVLRRQVRQIQYPMLGPLRLTPLSRVPLHVDGHLGPAHAVDEPALPIEERPDVFLAPGLPTPARSEEHTSELQSLMRISYAVFCLKKKKTHTQDTQMIKHSHTDINIQPLNYSTTAN